LGIGWIPRTTPERIEKHKYSSQRAELKGKAAREPDGGRAHERHGEPDPAMRWRVWPARAIRTARDTGKKTNRITRAGKDPSLAVPVSKVLLPSKLCWRGGSKGTNVARHASDYSIREPSSGMAGHSRLASVSLSRRGWSSSRSCWPSQIHACIRRRRHSTNPTTTVAARRADRPLWTCSAHAMPDGNPGHTS
jgi:hypothetical protein